MTFVQIVDVLFNEGTPTLRLCNTAPTHFSDTRYVSSSKSCSGWIFFSKDRVIDGNTTDKSSVGYPSMSCWGEGEVVTLPDCTGPDAVGWFLNSLGTPCDVRNAEFEVDALDAGVKVGIGEAERRTEGGGDVYSIGKERGECGECCILFDRSCSSEEAGLLHGEDGDEEDKEDKEDKEEDVDFNPHRTSEVSGYELRTPSMVFGARGTAT